MAYQEFSGELDNEEASFVEFNGELDTPPSGGGFSRSEPATDTGDESSRLAARYPAPQTQSLADVRASEAAQPARFVRTEPEARTPVEKPVSVLQTEGMDQSKPWSFAEASRAQRAIDDAPPRRPQGGITETPLATQIGMDARKAVTNPAGRGVMAGLAGLGQVIPGAVQAGADLVGADGVADAAGRVARTGQQVSAPLAPTGGTDKLVFDIANSITQTAPTLIVGLGGGPAMTALFGQSAAQEYTQGRAAGLDGGTAAARAGVMAGAEVLGERFGFGEQITILKGLTNRIPVDELAPVFARQIMKEIPGEQLTTLVQFLGDKYGPGAQNPEAALADYLTQAGETLKVTIGQTAVMGGGPVAASAIRKQYQRPVDRTPQIEALRKTGDETAAALLEQRQQKEQAAYNTERETDALSKFFPEIAQRYREVRMSGAKTGDAVVQTAARWNLDQAAQMAGLSPRAQEVIGAKLAEVPPEKAASFVQKAITGLVQAGQAQPFDGMDTIAQTIEAQRDQMLDSVLATMNDIETLEAQQDAEQKPAQAQADTAAADAVPAAAVPDGADAVSGGNEPGAVPALSEDWQQFPEQTGTLAVPRAEMPQVQTVHRGPLVNFLNARGVAHESVEVDPADLKPTQAEFSQTKVQEAADRDTDRSILISSDGYIIDGHHQAIAKLQNGKPVRAIRLDAPAADLLPLVREFPSSTTEQTNVQDEAPGTEAQAAAAPIEATPAGSAAAPAGVPAAPGAGDVQADGVDDLGPNTFAGSIKREMEARSAADNRKARAQKPVPPAKTQPEDVDSEVYRATPDGAGKFTLESEESTIAGNGDATPRKFASEADALKWAKENGFKTAALSQPKTETSPEPSKDAAQASQPELLGQNSQPMSEGGKPFKTELAARKEKKLHPDKRVVKVPDGKGFVLKPMTAKQIAAQEAAARRIRGADTGEKGPLSAHGFILARGGLAKSSMADAGFDKNIRIGNRWLFTDGGKTLAQAGEALKEAGYITEETENAASDIIRRSITSPQYTAEGWEAVAEAEAQTRFEDHLKAQQESEEDPFATLAEHGYTEEDAKGTGYDEASPEIQAEVAALSSQLEALGEDSESIRERVALQYPDATQQEYHEHVKAAITQAIAEAAQPAGRGDPGQDDGEQGQAREGAGESLSAEAAIRAAVEAVPNRTIGSWYPVTVTHNGRSQDFLSNIKRVISDGKGPQAIHLKQIKDGKLVASDPVRPLVYFYKLSRANDLSEEGVPRYADDADLKQWSGAFGTTESLTDRPDGTLAVKGDTKALRERLTAAGIPAKSILPSATGVVVGKTQAAKAREVLEAPALTAPTKADIEAQQDRAEQADKLDQREQIKRESKAGTGSFELTREDGRDGGTQPLFQVDGGSKAGDTGSHGQPDTRPEAGINLRLLGRDIAAYLRIPQREFDAVHPYDARVLQGAEDLQRIADAFGTEVQGFGLRVGLDEDAREQYGFFGGVRTSGVVFLRDQGGDRPHLAVLGHELGHQLRTRRPDLYDQLVDAIKPYVNEGKYEAEFVNSVVASNQETADKQQEEFIGEVLSDGFMDPDFWRAMGRKNRSLLEYVGNTIFELIEKALKAVGYTKRSAPYLNDYKAVMRIAGEVMAEFGAAPRGALGDLAFQTIDSSNTKRTPASVDAEKAIDKQTPAQSEMFQPGFWDAPQETRLDKVIYELADGRIDLKRVQESISKARAIPEKFDARLAETLYPGRVATRSERFLNDEAKPLLEAMARNNVTMDELSDYLHARHAEERNKQIAKVNPDLPDGGAGKNSKGVLMTTEAAKAHIDSLSEGKRMVLTAMAKRVDSITQGTTKLLVEEGLEKQETIDAWTGAYKSYVPLFRDEAENGNPHPSGSGMSIRGGSSKRAVGSKKKATNILAHVLMQREAAITRAEKNRVAVALYGLALTNPNPDFWTTIKPSMSPEAIGKELQRMGVDPTVAEAGMQGVPTIKTVDPTLGRVVSRPNPLYKSLPGAIVLKVNGDDRVLMLNTNDPRGLRMAENLKNLDGLTKFDIAGSVVGKATRWMASVNTQYNPAFGLVNLTRDTLGGAINLSSTKLRGKTLKVLALTPGALKGIGLELSGKKSGEWGRLFRQFQADGGQTGFREQFKDANDRAKALESELKALEKAGKLTPGKVADKMLGALDIFNTTLENAVRLAAYREALLEGMSRPEAARLGRELTVDFNRKGRMGRELGPLYAFFNASVQGTARTMQTLAGPAGAKIIAGGVSLGVLQAIMLLAAGYDDDEVPEFVKSRALIIPLGKDDDGQKRHLTIPLPLGLHVLPNTGRVLTELTLDGGKDAAKKGFEAVGEIAGAFNPLGGGSIFKMNDSGQIEFMRSTVKTLAPTIVDPFLESEWNENFAGIPIEREKFDNDPRPGFQRARESTLRTPTGQTYTDISRIINTMTGGDEYEAGKASPSPEMVRYWAQVVGGGLLREVEKIVNTSIAMSKGDDTKPTGFPVLGRFYGEVDDESVQRTRYYENLAAIEKAERMVKAAEKAGDLDAAQRIEEAKPEALLKKEKNRAQKDLRDLNREAMETVGDRQAIKEIDTERTAVMRDLNEAARESDRERRDGSLGGQLRKALGLADMNP